MGSAHEGRSAALGFRRREGTHDEVAGRAPRGPGTRVPACRYAASRQRERGWQAHRSMCGEKALLYI